MTEWRQVRRPSIRFMKRETCVPLTMSYHQPRSNLLSKWSMKRVSTRIVRNDRSSISTSSSLHRRLWRLPVTQSAHRLSRKVSRWELAVAQLASVAFHPVLRSANYELRTPTFKPIKPEEDNPLIPCFLRLRFSNHMTLFKLLLGLCTAIIDTYIHCDSAQLI